MFTTRNKTAQFDMNTERDLAAYDAILNNPLAFIVREIKEKLVDKHFDEEGNFTGQTERLVLVVTWQTKVLS
jgi:hypothetical protein